MEKQRRRGDRPLRVCHLAKFYPPATGGIETHLQTLAREQCRQGVVARVVCVNHRDASGKDVTWKIIARTRTVEEADGDVEVVRVGRWASLFRLEVSPALGRLGKLLRDWKADIVHLHVPNPTMLLPFVMARTRVPLVVTYHSDVIRQKLLALAQRPFEDRAFGRAAAILATSPPYADASETLQRYRSKVHVVPFGIELEPFVQPGARALECARQVRERHGGRNGSPIWLCVGRLVYYKGLATAIRAMQWVPGKLVVIGEGPMAGELGQTARDLGVADRVEFAGRVGNEELVGHYHAATALWFPSNARSEAFGFTQVEAMASGCPVVNMAIVGSGVPWVSRHEESGLTVGVDDAEALARAARRLVEEAGLRERLGAAGRKRALAEFDVATMARLTLDTYEHCLQNAGLDRASE